MTQVDIVFENKLTEPVWLMLQNKEDFDADVVQGMDKAEFSVPRYSTKIKPGENFLLRYVSISNAAKPTSKTADTGTKGTAGSIAYFARKCDVKQCQEGNERWNNDVPACKEAYGCDHGGLPGHGNALFEFDVDKNGRLWADLSAIDGIQDKEIHVDYGKCGNLGEAHCSMPPDIDKLYQFETYSKKTKFASSYQFSCFRDAYKNATGMTDDIFKAQQTLIQKLASHFPAMGPGSAGGIDLGFAYNFSGNSPETCVTECSMGGLSLKTAAFQMSQECGCTGCGVKAGFDPSLMKNCSGRGNDGTSTIDDLCRPPKGFQGSKQTNNITDTDYYKKLDKRCKNTYLYPYDDKNSTTQCAISDNPRIKVTIQEPGSVGRCKNKQNLGLLIGLGAFVAVVGILITKNYVIWPLWRGQNIKPLAIATVLCAVIWFILTIPAARVSKTTWWFWSDCSTAKTSTCLYSKPALVVTLVISVVSTLALAYLLYKNKIDSFPNLSPVRIALLAVALLIVEVMTISAVIKKKWFFWQRSCP